MIRAVFYGRKSNDDRGELGESINQQRDWATEAAARESAVIVREFSDQSISGGDMSRPGLQALLAFCAEQHRLGTPIEAVVCWKANRVSRADSFETGYFLHTLRMSGTARMLTSDRRWIDFNNPDDRLIFGIEQEATSHRQMVTTSGDVKRGKRTAAKKGQWSGGKAPFGYRSVGPDAAKKLEVNETEAEHVRFMFNEYANGTRGLREIAVEVTNRGIKPHTGKHWTVSTIWALLRNRVYLGHIVHGRRSEVKLLGSIQVPVKKRATKFVHNPQEQWITTPDAHPAIITQELFDRVQARCASNRKHTSPNKEYVLTGLLRCGNCGGTMSGRTFEKAADPKFYICGRYNTLGGKLSACTMNAINETKLLAAVAKKLAATYFNPTTLGLLRDAIRSAEEGTEAVNPERTLTARLGDLDKQIKKNSKRLMEMDDTLFEEFKAELLKLKEERTVLAGQLEIIRAKAVATEDLDARVEKILKRAENFGHALKNGERAETRATLREMIDHVELWFDVGTASRKRTKFARGMVYLHADSMLLGVTDLSGNRPLAGPRASGRDSFLFHLS